MVSRITDLLTDHRTRQNSDGGNLARGTQDFSFIHSRALFVTTSNESGSLKLFTFTCDRADSAFSSPSPSPFQAQMSTSPLTHVATLHLPHILPSAHALRVGTHTGPFLTACPLDSPFVASNEARIHVLTVQYAHLPTMDEQRTRSLLYIFMHHRVLEKYLERGDASAGAGAGARLAMEVPWSEWGPMHARAFPFPHIGIFQWLRWVLYSRDACVASMLIFSRLVIGMSTDSAS